MLSFHGPECIVALISPQQELFSAPRSFFFRLFKLTLLYNTT